jgi:hypothetical protein
MSLDQDLNPTLLYDGSETLTLPLQKGTCEQEQVPTASPGVAVVGNNATAGFDYAPLAKIADELRDTAARVRNRTMSCLIHNGRDLLRWRDQSKGRFHRWVEEECGLGVRTAQLSMMVAEFVDTHGGHEKFSRLTPSLQYLLATPSTPDQVREQVLNSYADGLPLKVTEVKKLIRNTKRTNQAGVSDESRPEKSDTDDSVHRPELSEFGAIEDPEVTSPATEVDGVAAQHDLSASQNSATRSARVISQTRLEVATRDPSKHDTIRKLATTLQNLPQPHRANLISCLDKLGDTRADKLAACLQ